MMRILTLLLISLFLGAQAHAGCGAAAGPGGSAGGSGGGGGGKDSFGITPPASQAAPEPTLQEQIKALESAVASDPEDKAAGKDLGIYKHQLALYKYKGASKAAVKQLKEAVRLDPDDAETGAWLGSAYTQSARDAWFPITKLVRVKKGIKMLDAAVEKAPGNFAIRMLRGFNSLNLPKFLKRRETGLADLRTLAGWLDEGRDIEVNFELDEALLSRIKADLYYHLARAEAEEKNPSAAEKYYAMAAEAGPGTPWGSAASARLEELRAGK